VSPVSEAHVFVCYGALSCDAAVRIVQGVLPPAARSYFLLMFAAEGVELPAGTTVLSMSPPPTHYTEWRKPFAIAAWFAEVMRRFDADGVTSIVAYLPHPFELPANHLSYHDARVKRLELLPDGLVNFTRSEVKPENALHALRYAARVGLRRLAARTVGLRYQPLARGHLTQYGALDYARTWLEEGAQALTRKGEIAALPPRRALSAPAELAGPALLILDQELRGFVHPSKAAALRGALVTTAKSMPVSRVYYKAHPRGENRAKALRDQGIDVVDVSGPDLAESLVQRLAITHLLGFYSTPLLLTDPAVRERISLLPDVNDPAVRRPDFLRDVQAALRASGAELRLVP